MFCAPSTCRGAARHLPVDTNQKAHAIWQRAGSLLAASATVLLAACSAGAPPAGGASGVAPAASQAASVAQAASAATPQPFDDAPTPALAELAASTGVPPAVTAALARSRIPIEQVALLVAPADGGAPLVNLHTGTALNPASVMKLVTTAAALDVLGAAYTWRTPVWADGHLHNDTLRGNLYIQGQGDPKLVVERLWLLLQQVRQAGMQHIEGDLVLDNTAFALPPHEAGAFDGEPLRPYNAAPDALLVNFKSLVLNFTPDTAQGVARVGLTPPLAGVTVTPTLPLSNADCGAWHNKLGAAVGNSRVINFTGSYPTACGSKSWALAYAAPNEFAARAIAGMWLQLGGSISGQVRFAAVPETVRQRPPLAEAVSPALTEVIRDINKYSNNVMASQVFLSMGLHASGMGSYDSANATVQQWWRTRLGDTPPPVISNGSGLSRTDRISASSLGAMLQAMWKSPSMSEFVSSMPIAGIDGTLRRSRVRQPGSSHLKTGTLNNASALAGYVLANNGKHYVLVAMANGAGAAAARPAFEALVDWTMELPADMASPSAHAAPDMPAQPATPAVQNPAQDDPFAVVFPGAYAPQATTPGATPETADQ